LVDDSTKLTRQPQAGQLPPDNIDLSRKASESVLRTIDARIGLTNGIVAQVSSSSTALAASLRADTKPSRPVREASVSGSAKFRRGDDKSSVGNGTLAFFTAADEPTAEQPISYHPPRKPPESVVPPAPSVSFSVAPEYDPRAPTRPRVRRSSLRPPPVSQTFGLDRMLVWGMLLGGVFVAVVVMLVYRLAPVKPSEREQKERLLSTNSSFSTKSLPPSTQQPDSATTIASSVSSATLTVDKASRTGKPRAPSSSPLRGRSTSFQQARQSTSNGGATSLWIE
jgi:hypothetical protein